MKTQNQVRITNENTRITENNVQHIGECIALPAIKKMMQFAHHPRSLDKLYAGLLLQMLRQKKAPLLLQGKHPKSRLGGNGAEHDAHAAESARESICNRRRGDRGTSEACP